MNEATDNAPISEEQRPRFAMKGQYIKDLSLENPHAPESLLSMKDQPKVDLNLDLQAQKIQGNLCELTITLNVRTTAGDRPLFILDLTYAGIFELVNIPEQVIERVLLVDSAFALFPFARRVVSDITRDSGFPPLLLEPVDFLGLFEQRKKQQADQAATAGAPAEGSAAAN